MNNISSPLRRINPKEKYPQGSKFSAHSSRPGGPPQNSSASKNKWLSSKTPITIFSDPNADFLHGRVEPHRATTTSCPTNPKRIPGSCRVHLTTSTDIPTCTILPNQRYPMTMQKGIAYLRLHEIHHIRRDHHTSCHLRSHHRRLRASIHHDHRRNCFHRSRRHHLRSHHRHRNRRRHLRSHHHHHRSLRHHHRDLLHRKIPWVGLH
mmetsp:Transcript_16750/g.34562  ORF Transcript_16750/g.34562 Transcript_16750/m.34562 type:complete len:207 (-) Transcript_16750:886-1506(-)